MIYSQGSVVFNTGERSSKTTAAGGQVMCPTALCCVLSAFLNWSEPTACVYTIHSEWLTCSSCSFLRQNVLVQSKCCKHANEMSVLAVRGAVWQPSFLRCVLALRCVFSYFAKAERSVHTTRVDGPCSRLVWTGAREHGP